jgi:hypothetical protein
LRGCLSGVRIPFNLASRYRADLVEEPQARIDIKGPNPDRDSRKHENDTHETTDEGLVRWIGLSFTAHKRSPHIPEQSGYDECLSHPTGDTACTTS